MLVDEIGIFNASEDLEDISQSCIGHTGGYVVNKNSPLFDIFLEVNKVLADEVRFDEKFPSS